MTEVPEFVARLRKGEFLDEKEVKFICGKCKELVIEESNVQTISVPVTVVGDVHGQLYDVFELFKVGGWPPDTNYLFLGDYVDRGYFSVETISLLVCLKLLYPNRLTLLRGNHETRNISQVYGFQAECIRKYGSAAVWQYFTELFDYLSISAIIESSLFCVHGGLSPFLHSLDQIRCLNRFGETPHEGPLSDLLWSDPEPNSSGWAISARGAGYTYGADVVNTFLATNDLDCIFRAHQLCLEGYQELFDGKLVTIWSAPNYCYRCKNVASILEVNESLSLFFNVFAECPRSERRIPPDIQTQGKEQIEYFT
eukprot:TRINITY_DN31898_c0_g1_i1.p1 TRINITY_DN31898_c0_g1~~TRINITY_DN31898_c0_g1_i1.p1  ORF type:complete len:311 (-),score=29.37 TRINITY_DN31898_c0_g1_i1:357-1289(-)